MVVKISSHHFRWLYEMWFCGVSLPPIGCTLPGSLNELSRAMVALDEFIVDRLDATASYVARNLCLRPPETDACVSRGKHIVAWVGLNDSTLDALAR